jgi:proteic killer suppression protein
MKLLGSGLAGGVASTGGYQTIAPRKLRLINNAQRLDDLRIPPGNRLEALRGLRRSQHSIRINDQWRVCFVWKEGHAREVEIVDYH